MTDQARRLDRLPRSRRLTDFTSWWRRWMRRHDGAATQFVAFAVRHQQHRRRQGGGLGYRDGRVLGNGVRLSDCNGCPERSPSWFCDGCGDASFWEYGDRGDPRAEALTLAEAWSHECGRIVTAPLVSLTGWPEAPGGGDGGVSAQSRPEAPPDDGRSADMSDPTGALDVARRELARRALAADEQGDWQERVILFHLTTVADMVCRIGDHRDSAHYRADKVATLVDAALALEAECLNAYLGDGCDETAADLERASRVLRGVAETVREAMWSFARADSGAALDADDVRDLGRAAAAFVTWTDGAIKRAVTASELALPDMAGDMAALRSPHLAPPDRGPGIDIDLS